MKLHPRIPIIVTIALAVLAGCTSGTSQPPTATSPAPSPTPCVLEPIAIPTPPAEIPGYTELDPTTGLHVTGTAPEIDLTTYRLEISGKVERPLSLSYDDLRCMPRIERTCTIVCPGFFQDDATWAGASLDHILEQAGVQPEADRLRLVSADGYSRIVFLNQLLPEDDFIAYEWEGEPVPIIHGFPVRAVFPALNGNNWVKWLVEIEVF
jgi:DMSO/TMAO reductase YedYZ molybdopterin-dependent catalytic subunit